MSDKDGGPAFPQAGWKYEPAMGRYVESVSGGMSLRDWFAGQALANPAICQHGDEWPQKTAYAFADAMLEARK